MKSNGIPSRTYMDRTGHLTVWPGNRPLPVAINPRKDRGRARDLRMSQRRMLSLWLIVLMLIGALVMSTAKAMTISYMLTQSNVLVDGVHYLKVTLDDEGSPGSVNVTVEPQAGLLAGSHFGLQSFGFNGASLTSANINFNGDAGAWRVVSAANLSEFGRFDVLLKGTGNSRVAALHFSIVGIDDDNPLTYAPDPLHSSRVLFAGHVAGLAGVYNVTSAWIGGSMPVPPLAVPLPASSGLFGIGFLTLVGMSRRTRWRG